MYLKLLKFYIFYITFIFRITLHGISTLFGAINNIKILHYARCTWERIILKKKIHIYGLLHLIQNLLKNIIKVNIFLMNTLRLSLF